VGAFVFDEQLRLYAQLPGEPGGGQKRGVSFAQRHDGTVAGQRQKSPVPGDDAAPCLHSDALLHNSGPSTRMTLLIRRTTSSSSMSARARRKWASCTSCVTKTKSMGSS